MAGYAVEMWLAFSEAIASLTRYNGREIPTMRYLMFYSGRQMTETTHLSCGPGCLDFWGLDAVILAWASATTRDPDKMHAKN